MLVNKVNVYNKNLKTRYILYFTHLKLTSLHIYTSEITLIWATNFVVLALSPVISSRKIWAGAKYRVYNGSFTRRGKLGFHFIFAYLICNPPIHSLARSLLSVFFNSVSTCIISANFIYFF